MPGSVRIVLVAVIAVLTLFACTPQGNNGLTTLKIEGTVPAGTGAASIRAIDARAVTSIDIPVEYPAGTAVGILSLTQVQIVLKEFEIEQEGSQGDGEFEFNGPYLVDMIAQTITPEPSAVDLPEGTYSQIKFKIDRVEGDEEDDDGTPLAGQTDPIFGHSIYLTGTYSPTGGSPANFEYTFDTDAEFELTPSGDTSLGFAVDTLGADIIIAFRLNKWFAGIDPAAFAADPGNFAEDLKENIKVSADYGEDQDGDGHLESDEDDDPDTEDAEDE